MGDPVTDRDELAMLIEPHMQGVGWHDRARQIADAILAAGWRAPTCTQHEIGLAPDGRLWCHRCGMRLQRGWGDIEIEEVVVDAGPIV